MLKTIMVVNRVEEWENTVKHLKQQITDLEHDIASFKNFCLAAQKKEDEQFEAEKKSSMFSKLIKKDNKHLT